MHHAPRTTHHAPRTTHHAPRTTHHAPRTTHHASRITLAAMIGLPGLLSNSASAQTDVGPACRADGGLRSVSNIFDPGIGDIFADGLYRVFAIGDLDSDGTQDLLAVDYDQDSHFVAAASGATGDVFYTLESVAPRDFYFAVDAHPIDDVDQDGIPDFILVSHDGFLSTIDVMVISGVDGHGIARITRDSITPDQSVYTVTPFSDMDKSGSTDVQDIYLVMDAAAAGVLAPETDLNLDGVTDSSDVIQGQNQSGPLSLALVSQIAVALGGTASGMQVTIVQQEGGGPTGWFGFVWNCIGCLINCGDSYGAAWDCRNQARQARCDCWDLPLPDISPCLDDVRHNFIANCIADAAAAAGACGQCILDCHPLAPPTPPTGP